MDILPMILAVLSMSQTAKAQLAAAEQARLEACINRIDEDPEDAYEYALAWASAGGRPAARQCTAMALLALDRPADAAARLEALANAPDAGSLEQRAIYLAQAGNSWLIAGAFEAAIVTLDNAIKLNPQDPLTRVDRALAKMGLEQWAGARSDLDEALALQPDYALAYRLRAQTNLSDERLTAAMSDVNSSLAIEPDNLDTLVLRGQVREAMRLARGQ